MKKFIRLDFDRNFRGTEHVSSFGGDVERFEKGISCYEITKETIFDAIEDLYKYWTNIGTERDFENYQITIFEGLLIRDSDGQKSKGSDWEDLAECTNNDTIIKLDGSLFNKVYELFEMYDNYKNGWTDEDDDPWITEEGLQKEIAEMFIKYL